MNYDAENEICKMPNKAIQYRRKKILANLSHRKSSLLKTHRNIRQKNTKTNKKRKCYFGTYLKRQCL